VASTHAVESCVVSARLADVWLRISALDFSWWSLVDSTSLIHGSSWTVGAVISLKFKDGVNWDIQIVEMSNIRNSVTFEVIACEPPSAVSSVIHTIQLKKVGKILIFTPIAF
jgi:hypothetical protein